MVNATAVLKRHRLPARLTVETVAHYRATARPTPLVVGARGCLECGHELGCGCDCCGPYPLPAVVGTLVGTGVEA